MKIISFHRNKSTSAGGLQSLIRSFHSLSGSGEFELEEVFFHKPNELFTDNNNVKYTQLSNQSKFDKLNSIRRYFKDLGDERNVIVLYRPFELLFLPTHVIKKNHIVLVQSNKLEEYFRGVNKLAFMMSMRHVDDFCVYTDHDKNKLIKLYPDFTSRINVIPRGCRLVTSTETARFSKKLVTIIRVQEEQKNIQGMVDILVKLGKDYTLDIYGDGTIAEIENLKLIIKDVDNVKFNGATKDVKSTLSLYSVFLMTSYFEGFGQTLIEARSQGLPLIAYNTFDALPFIIEDGVNGFKINPFDIDEYISKILTITKDPSTYETYSINSLKMAGSTEQNFILTKWKTIFKGN